MSDLVVVVPSRGRPEKVRELGEAFAATCTAGTPVILVVDEDDPSFRQYHEVAGDLLATGNESIKLILTQPAGNMATALQLGAVFAARSRFAVGFMGDDHRPRTTGWDQAYLDALRELGTGIVYGNDLLQGERLPTQCAMTADIVRALGYMAPPELVHLYLDDFWRTLGQRAGCLRYLADVVVEHVHPIAGKAEWDEGYERVNNPAMYERDREAFAEYFRTRLVSDVAKVRALSKVDR